MKNYTCILVSALCLFGVLSACSDEPNPEPENKIPFQTVTDFIIDAQNTKFIATNKGLYTFDENTGIYSHQSIDENFETIQCLAINSAFTPGQLWLATENGAYNFESQTMVNASNSQLPENNIAFMSFDSQSVTYYAHAGGISIQHNETWLQNQGKNNIYQFYAISGMGTASNGYTYVGTDGAGVERFKYDVDGISGATIFDKDWTKLNSNQITTVYVKDTLQAYGTYFGATLHYSEFAKWDWETYTRRNGLISDTVLAICQDAAKNWWFGTPRGISKFDGTSWTNFTKATSGLLSDTVKFLSTDTQGTVWMATDYGLSKFSADTWTNYKK